METTLKNTPTNFSHKFKALQLTFQVVYYQSFEAVVAKKLLGNLADTDLDGTLEPCVLKGPCDGRQPTVEMVVGGLLGMEPVLPRRW